jgi:hypothetical protein
MISKNKMWLRISSELKEIGRSKQMTENIMTRIRKLDHVDHQISTSQDDKRRD